MIEGDEEGPGPRASPAISRCTRPAGAAIRPGIADPSGRFPPQLLRAQGPRVRGQPPALGPSQEGGRR